MDRLMWVQHRQEDQLTHVLRMWLRRRLLSDAEATHRNLATLATCDHALRSSIPQATRQDLRHAPPATAKCLFCPADASA
eukprot:1506549-Amphidinium_carterae.2